MTHKKIFATNTVMHARANTTPAVNNPLSTIICGTDILTCVNPMMVYVQHKSHMLAHSKSTVKTIGYLVVFYGDKIASFGSHATQSLQELGSAASAAQVYIDHEPRVVPGTAIAHPASHVCMILKFKNAAFHNLIIVTGQHTKLTGMKTQSHI